MSKFTKEMIDQYAEKLLIKLSAEENAMVLNEFEAIEESMNLINKIPDLNKVEIMSHPYELSDVKLREDASVESISLEDALSNCDRINDREVEIPRVVE